jgi:hypothetical protein
LELDQAGLVVPSLIKPNSELCVLSASAVCALYSIFAVSPLGVALAGLQSRLRLNVSTAWFAKDNMRALIAADCADSTGFKKKQSGTLCLHFRIRRYASSAPALVTGGI